MKIVGWYSDQWKSRQMRIPLKNSSYTFINVRVCVSSTVLHLDINRTLKYEFKVCRLELAQSKYSSCVGSDNEFDRKGSRS